MTAARNFGCGRTLLCCVGAGIVFGACEAAPGSIEMEPAERLLGVIGMTARMNARQVARNGTILGGSISHPERFSWSSDAPELVTVDSLGVLMALSEGTARITATSGRVTGTATVTVRDAARVAWSLSLGGPANAGLTIADDGTIYVAAAGTLRAVDPEGRELWSVDTGKAPQSTPAIGTDGTIYVATAQSGASLMAVDRSGAVRWTLATIGPVLSSPAIGQDGTVYAASRDSALYAVDPAGRERWAFKAQGSFHLSSPAVARDGTILVGAEDGRLYAVGPDGTERWSFQTRGAIWSSPAIAIDGTIYFGSHDEHLYALTPDGTEKWRVGLGREIHSSPAIGSDGTVYVGAGGIHAIDPSGRVRWRYAPSFPRTSVVSTPLVAGDGSIYFGGLDGSVYALAPDGTPKWNYPTGSLVVPSPAIGIDGTLLVASYDHMLYAIVELEGWNGGFESAPWPKARRDRANTGSADGA